MGNARIFLTVAVILVAGTQISAKKVTPPKKETHPLEYDFRGAKLAMTLQEFKSASFPDADSRPGKAICSNDAESNSVGITLFLDDYEKAAGVVKCGYFSLDTRLKDWWDRAQVSVGTTGYASTDLSYDFVPDPNDGVLKLYSIDLTTNSDALQSALDGISQKFGPASAHVNDSVQNRMGANFAHSIITWVNPLSMIYVESPSFKIDEMTISYTELRLAAVVAKAKEKVQGPASSKM